LTSGSGIWYGKNLDPGSGIKIPDHNSKSLVVNNFWVKIVGFSIIGVLQTIGAVLPLCGPALQTGFSFDRKHIFNK
jgi:hypothetical protein